MLLVYVCLLKENIYFHQNWFISFYILFDSSDIFPDVQVSNQWTPFSVRGVVKPEFHLFFYVFHLAPSYYCNFLGAKLQILNYLKTKSQAFQMFGAHWSYCIHPCDLILYLQQGR